MTITPIFLDRLTAEVPAQTWKSFPKRWRAVRPKRRGSARGMFRRRFALAASATAAPVAPVSSRMRAGRRLARARRNAGRASALRPCPECRQRRRIDGLSSRFLPAACGLRPPRRAVCAARSASRLAPCGAAVCAYPRHHQGRLCRSGFRPARSRSRNRNLVALPAEAVHGAWLDLQRIHLLASSGSRRAPSASPRVVGDKPASQRDRVRLRLSRLHPFRAEISRSVRLPARRSRRRRNSARRYGRKGATGTRRPASGGLDPAARPIQVVKPDQVERLRPADARGRVRTWASSATKSGGYGRVRTVGDHLALRDHRGAADVHLPVDYCTHPLLSAATAGARTLQRQAPDRPDAASRTVTGNSSVEF